MFANLEGLISAQHLLVVGIIAILLFGKRMPELARFLGSKSMEFKKGYRRLLKEIRGVGDTDRTGPDDEEPGASLARLEPPDKPRPPAQAALTSPESTEF